MGTGAAWLQGHGAIMPVKQPLSRLELEDLHSVLRRAAERAERNNMIRHAEKLAREVAAIADELARTG
jgi:hypothetical protein